MQSKTEKNHFLNQPALLVWAQRWEEGKEE